MLHAAEVESLCTLIAALDRPAVTWQLRHFKARFPLDFSSDFLASEPLDRLRHILFGLCLHTQKLPETSMALAA